MIKYCLAFLLTASMMPDARALEVIRINQLGYLPDNIKVAVFLSDQDVSPGQFSLVDNLTGKTVFRGHPEKRDGASWGRKSAFRLNFTRFTKPGGYHLVAGNASSPAFAISNDVYRGTADFILHYMRQQRCGYNPFLKDSCHTHDGIIANHPTRNGQRIDAVGGWHDASDYLQYTITSANAIYQMLFAYRENPQVYGDFYRENGLPGANGIPDILDEARWGLDWLLKMNPARNEMYFQVADDRDHRGYRLPTQDTASYGLGKKFRPVYFVTGRPVGTGTRRNRTTGVASTAAKFSSAFALGSEIFRKYDASLADKLLSKATEAWDFALTEPGVCQTTCVVSPYFYEEENFTDDLELAAATLYGVSHKEEYKLSAAKWGELEQVTPWMELHRARHYQYYPFVNLGHYLVANAKDSLKSARFASFMRDGLNCLKRFGGNDIFPTGIPFIWCSNNLVVAAATQARLYRQATGDRQFEELETTLVDWLFGCNPWGTSMICGLPQWGDFPEDPHSAIRYWMKINTLGGLVDGPVYQDIYKSLLGITLHNPDEYAAFQSGIAVYHDDNGDYSTNEPTMDGTASLSYLLSSLENQGRVNAGTSVVTDSQGGVVRMNQAEKKIYLVFSAHEFAEGGAYIRKTLLENQVKASFFFTGDFYQNKKHRDLIQQLVHDGHYLGAHSDRHLLYADWNKRDSTLIRQEDFRHDLQKNYEVMQNFGINSRDAEFFLPPYEWYNKEVVGWSRLEGLTLINMTPGTRTNADYTTPEMKSYISSDDIIRDLKRYEAIDSHGLNGTILLIHLGTAPERSDKFYLRLPELIQYFGSRGYQLCRLGNSLTGSRSKP